MEEQNPCFASVRSEGNPFPFESVKSAMANKLNLLPSNDPNYFDGVVYSFAKVIKTGFGAKIHDILMAYHYAKKHNKTLYLVEGEPWHALVGYDLKTHHRFADGPSAVAGKTGSIFHRTHNGWHMIFRSLPNVISAKKLTTIPQKYVWPNAAHGGWDAAPPKNWEGSKFQWFHELMMEIFYP